MNINMLEVFFQGVFQFRGKIEEQALYQFAQEQIVGNEYLYCTFEKDDEDYREGYVTVIFFEPFVEKDIVMHIEKKIFYDELLVFLQELSTDSIIDEKLDNYLNIIKTKLCI